MEHYLSYTGYPLDLSNKLVNGFTYGFDLGHYFEPLNVPHKAVKMTNDFSKILQNKIDTEIITGRIKGPFIAPPFDNFQVSPVTIREKSTQGKYRLLHNLSFPYDGSSINDNIDEQRKSVKYSTITDAIKCLSVMGRGAYTAKCDIKDAFRLIPIRPEDHPKLCIFFNNNYYYDTTLPMGSSSSCQLFELFSTALHHIAHHFMPNCKIVHYLDDYLFMAESNTLCQEYLNVFTEICEDIGVPISPEKTTRPSTATTFLGIELDTVSQAAKLPLDKLKLYCTDITQVLSKGSITKRSLQSLLGKLNFASSVVPARAFLRRLICLLSRAALPHHFINLNKSARSDLKTWLIFLDQYNGITYFRSLKTINSSTLNMCSDASKKGFGATFGANWIQCRYTGSWPERDITVLELYPFYVMIALFGDRIRNSNIMFLCDNMAIVQIINKQSSKHGFIMSIVRSLVLLLVKFNINLMSNHIPGKNNILCDKLSRFQNAKELLERANMVESATEIPLNLLPENFIELP